MPCWGKPQRLTETKAASNYEEKTNHATADPVHCSIGLQLLCGGGMMPAWNVGREMERGTKGVSGARNPSRGQRIVWVVFGCRSHVKAVKGKKVGPTINHNLA